jgi:glycine cleavage system H protein
MGSPSDRYFSESHEWFRPDGDLVTVGITQYAANELTDITYVEMKPVGTAIAPGDSLGEVESVKTTSDVYAAIGGEIVDVNAAVGTDPSLINSDPFGAGWLVRIRAVDLTGLEVLMDQERYDDRHPVE